MTQKEALLHRLGLEKVSAGLFSSKEEKDALRQWLEQRRVALRDTPKEVRKGREASDRSRLGDITRNLNSHARTGRRAAIGSAIGALGGGGLGALVSSKERFAGGAAGAALGAILGAITGSQTSERPRREALAKLLADKELTIDDLNILGKQQEMADAMLVAGAGGGLGGGMYGGYKHVNPKHPAEAVFSKKLPMPDWVEAEIRKQVMG